MPKRGMKALSKKRRNLPIRSESVNTLEDALMGSIGETVDALAAMHTAAGTPLTQIDLGGGTVIDVKLPPGPTGWEDRLRSLIDAVDFVLQQDPSQDSFSVADQLLAADGWIMNKWTLKTPAWLIPHAEIEWVDLDNRFEWVKNVQDWRKSKNP